MKQPINLLLILLFPIFVFLISCGQLDTPTQAPISPSTTNTNDLPPNEPLVEIDLAAEEKAIRAEHQALTDDINARDRDPNVVTSHWLQKGSVLMAHNFFGELVASQSTKKIRGSWKVVFKRRAPWPMKSTIETLSIDEKRGQTAWSEGTFEYQSREKRPFKALYQKNKEEKWKIKAMDYGDNGFIKGFQIAN